MSWSLFGTGVARDDLSDAIQKSADSQLANQPFDSWDDDIQKQMEAAKTAAEIIVGAVNSKKVNFSVSGHAKRGETDVSSVNVSISDMYVTPDLKAKK